MSCVITCLVLLLSKDSFSYYKTVDCARILDIHQELDNLLPGKDTKAFLSCIVNLLSTILAMQNYQSLFGFYSLRFQGRVVRH